MDKRYAVMDLGTNVFHLLIAEGNEHDFRILIHEHVAVKLGEGGINQGIIQPAAFARGVNTMKSFRQKIDENNVQSIKAIATSAVRNASNGQDFIQSVKAEADIEIEMISGEREAGLIYEGIKATGLLSAQNSLIMDIGGGSIEFIICNDKQLLWKQSFEIGAARLMDRFHHSDPIPPDSVEALNLYLEHRLGDLFDAIKNAPVYNLIGSSGAFETFAELVELKRNDDFDLTKIKSYEFDYEDLLLATGTMIKSSHTEREANEAVIPVRVDMIVVSSIVTRFIIQKLAIKHIALSTYSLKEGILAEMMK